LNPKPQTLATLNNRSIELNTKLYGAQSSQVGLTYSEKATFVQYLTDPTKEQTSLAISLATKGDFDTADPKRRTLNHKLRAFIESLHLANEG
jgi:hypothetical protein